MESSPSTKITGQILAVALLDSNWDWVSVSEVIGTTREISGSDAIDFVRTQVFGVVECLLRSDLMRVGRPRGGQFHPWPDSPSEAVARIRREWDIVIADDDRPDNWPSVADMSWLDATEAGEVLAKLLEKSFPAGGDGDQIEWVQTID